MARLGARHSPIAAIAAATLTAFSFFQLTYSVQARGYATATLALLIAYGELERGLDAPRSGARWTLALASGIGFFSHLAMGPVIALLGMISLAETLRRRGDAVLAVGESFALFWPTALAMAPTAPATANYTQTPKEMELTRGAAAVQNRNGTQSVQPLQSAQPMQRQLQTRGTPALQDLTQPCSRTIENEAELAADIKGGAPEINFDYALIQRLNPVDLTTRLIPFNLGKLVLQHDQSVDLEIESGDIVMIFSQRDVRGPQQKQSKFVLSRRRSGRTRCVQDSARR